VFKDGSSSVDDGSSSVDASQIDAIEISKNEGDKNNLNKFKRTASWYKTASNKISSQVTSGNFGRIVYQSVF
jgi:hypothetical protein